MVWSCLRSKGNVPRAANCVTDWSSLQKVWCPEFATNFSLAFPRCELEVKHVGCFRRHTRSKTPRCDECNTHLFSFTTRTTSFTQNSEKSDDLFSGTPCCLFQRLGGMVLLTYMRGGGSTHQAIRTAPPQRPHRRCRS